LSDEPAAQSENATSNGIDFYYEKAPSYRTVHADGFVVSPNAKGAIAITFYSERLTIPRHVRLEFDDEGEGDEQILEAKDGIFRQMEITTFIDTETASELREWLERAISTIDEAVKQEPGEESERE